MAIEKNSSTLKLQFEELYFAFRRGQERLTSSEESAASERYGCGFRILSSLFC